MAQRQDSWALYSLHFMSQVASRRRLRLATCDLRRTVKQNWAETNFVKEDVEERILCTRPFVHDRLFTKEAAMNLRRALWIVIPLLSVLVLAGGGALVWLLLRAGHEPVRLVVVGPDTRVRVVEDGGGERVLAGDANTASYGFPAPAPDGRRLAYVVADANGAAIVVVELGSGERKELYRSRTGDPIDLAWSPDGKELVFLLDVGRTVHIVPADGSESERLIATGPRSFFAWSPDSTTLLLHLGGHRL